MNKMEIRENNSLIDIIIKVWSETSLLQGLQGVTNEDLRKLAVCTQVIMLQPEEILFREGEPIDRLCFLVRGQLKMVKKKEDGSKVEVVLPGGKVIGELEVYRQKPAPGEIKAGKESLLFVVFRDDWQCWLAARPGVAWQVMANLAEMAYQSLPFDQGLFKVEEEKLEVKVQDLELLEGSMPEAEKSAMSADEEITKMLYRREFKCPLCEGVFSAWAVKSRYIQVENIDSDFCTRYRLLDPTFYDLLVCPWCHYAYPADYQQVPTAEMQEKLKSLLLTFPSGLDVSSIRDLPMAILLTKWTLQVQKAAAAPASLLGRLALRLACYYRHQGWLREEMIALGEALNYLQLAYQQDKKMDVRKELNLLYLLGDINARLGDTAAAVKWFNLVVNHPQRQQNPLIVNRAKERWQDIRYVQRRYLEEGKE